LDGLYAVARALRAGDAEAVRRALSPALFPADAKAALARLSALPPLPRAGFAASFAGREMNRQDSEDGRREVEASSASASDARPGSFARHASQRSFSP
jgi:hypothetical protein